MYFFKMLKIILGLIKILHYVYIIKVYESNNY